VATLREKFMSAPKSVVDTNGTKYVLGKPLGTGGQGTVFEVEGGKFAVKLLTKTSGTEIRRVERHFLHLKQLPLDGIPIAKPISVLRQPYAGYVMPLLQNMEPIAKLVLPPRGSDSIGEWYRNTGSLKKRLRCLASTGDAIAALHANGLCYGDVSPANIFIPTTATNDDAWLIDSDNLHYESNTTTQQFYTPGYGAPELASRTGTTSSLSDAYSVGVLAFRALVQCHPLIGDMVHDGEPELEERAYRGEFPWIDHQSDPINQSSRGIPRPTALSKGLIALAARTFESGLLDKVKRPSAREWAEGLWRAAAHSLVCSGCRGSYYRNSDCCPWCGMARAAFVYVRVRTRLAKSGKFLEDLNGKEITEDSLAVSQSDTATLRATTAFGLSATNRSAAIVGLKYDGTSLTIERLSEDAYIEIRYRSTRGLLGTDPHLVPIDASLSQLSIHFGPESSDHRVVDFTDYAGVRS